jgi:O-succinylbenzoic acid--CoA ligase
MVPLQVYNSLQVAAERERLRQIRHLIIGGGAIDESLQAALKDFPYAVWSTYGMTETLSHIALRRLNGPTSTDWYTPFDGVRVSQTSEGCLVIDAPAVHEGTLVTNDMVELDGQRFRVLGRKDNVICSGGIKIQAEEVERMLHAHITNPYLITRAKDERLGQQVVLMIERGDADEAMRVCRQVLPKYWQPRRIVVVDRLPMTQTGKPARAEAEKLVAEDEKRNGTHPHG